MNSDLRGLIDDSRFRAYRRELVRRREFNTFDVLQYANYEIRHSNVLAWLLRPGGTHGIGPRFLKWFVGRVNDQLPARDRVRPETGFEAANVDVWRERDYVDITIRFRRERCLIAVENKTESASSGHLDQVMSYDRTLREKHEGHTVRSVLLSASPDVSVKFPGIAHVGWDSVGGAIGSILADGGFQTPSVDAFIRQYVNMVDRWLRPVGGNDLKALLDDHRRVLTEMRRVLEKDGDDGLRRMVPTEYRDSLVRLVRESRHEPRKLRTAVADYLKGRGATLRFSHNPSQTVYWLGWQERDLGDAVGRMGGQPKSGCWGMQFSHRNVELAFSFYRDPEDATVASFVDRLMRFVEKTPINRQKPNEYRVPIENRGYGWYGAYRKEILSCDELIEMSVPEVRDEVIRRLEEFMDSDDSEYRRIDDYFQCLAFGFELDTRHSVSQAGHP